MADIELLGGLGSVAGRYDALICDVWGVLHDGEQARAPAVEALRRFRARFGPVILLSNAPRPAEDVEAQFARVGVPQDCYDAIQTSGMAARADLERRLAHGPVRLYHLGPERDAGIFAGLKVTPSEPEAADLVLCTGLYDDVTETADDYRDRLAALAARRLPLLCANPDLKVQRGGQLVYCAGALAQLYEEFGGEVVYYGKPHRPIYEATMALAARLAGRPIARPLAIGDGLHTDIKGANAYGMDALFIADGVHGEEIGAVTAENIARVLAAARATAIGAMEALMW